MDAASVRAAAASRSRWELADVFRLYGNAYRCAHKLPAAHLKVMHAVQVCRTQALGGHLERCDSCGSEQPCYNSCRNRHCPKCGSSATDRWLARHKRELLPTGYFHLVFTVPHELNFLFLTNPKVLIPILFKAVSETLSDFGRTHLHGRIGFLAVLHTWDQTLRDHFHLHCLIPGGALSSDGERWIAARSNFLFHVRALGVVFRAKFLDHLTAAYGKDQLHFPGRAAQSLPFRQSLRMRESRLLRLSFRRENGSENSHISSEDVMTARKVCRVTCSVTRESSGVVVATLKLSERAQKSPEFVVKSRERAVKLSRYNRLSISSMTRPIF